MEKTSVHKRFRSTISTCLEKWICTSHPSTSYTFQMFQFREIPEHLWEPSEVGSPNTSQRAALKSGHVDVDSWRVQAFLCFRSSIGVSCSETVSKTVASLGLWGNFSHVEIWQELLGFCGMGFPQILGISINYHKMRVAVLLPDLTWPTLPYSSNMWGAGRKDGIISHPFLWAMDAASRWLFNTY